MKKKTLALSSMIDHFVTWILIPICLFGLWIFLSFNYTYHLQTGLTVLEHDYRFSSNLLTNKFDKSIATSFIAKENYMGIVSMHFASSSRGDIQFRIKESQSPSWLYQATLDAFVFGRDSFFTFGFPVIEKSKGKSYTFEISSLNGPLSDYLQFDKYSNTFSVKYQQPKSGIMDTPIHTISFGIKKIVNLFQDFGFTFHILAYTIPLIIYYLIVEVIIGNRFNLKKSKIKLQKKYFPFSQYLDIYTPINRFIKSGYSKTFAFKSTSLIAFFILVSIFYLNFYNDQIFALLALFWVGNIFIHKLSPRLSAILGIIFLILTSIIVVLNKAEIADKASAWAYVMLFTSILQELIQLRKKK